MHGDLDLNWVVKIAKKIFGFQREEIQSLFGLGGRRVGADWIKRRLSAPNPEKPRKYSRVNGQELDFFLSGLSVWFLRQPEQYQRVAYSFYTQIMEFAEYFDDCEMRIEPGDKKLLDDSVARFEALSEHDRGICRRKTHS